MLIDSSTALNLVLSCKKNDAIDYANKHYYILYIVQKNMISHITKILVYYYIIIGKRQFSATMMMTNHASTPLNYLNT